MNQSWAPLPTLGHLPASCWSTPTFLTVRRLSVPYSLSPLPSSFSLCVYFNSILGRRKLWLIGQRIQSIMAGERLRQRQWDHIAWLVHISEDQRQREWKPRWATPSNSFAAWNLPLPISSNSTTNYGSNAWGLGDICNSNLNTIYHDAVPICWWIWPSLSKKEMCEPSSSYAQTWVIKQLFINSDTRHAPNPVTNIVIFLLSERYGQAVVKAALIAEGGSVLFASNWHLLQTCMVQNALTYHKFNLLLSWCFAYWRDHLIKILENVFHGTLVQPGAKNCLVFSLYNSRLLSCPPPPPRALMYCVVWSLILSSSTPSFPPFSFLFSSPLSSPHLSFTP